MTTKHMDPRGFTLIELMIVVVVLGILVGAGIANFISMSARAREGSTKANMHSFQLSAEDLAIRQDGDYGTAAGVSALLSPNFKNPFDLSQGDGGAWEANTAPSKAGIVAYDEDGLPAKYTIRGGDHDAHTLSLELTNGD